MKEYQTSFESQLTTINICVCPVPLFPDFCSFNFMFFKQKPIGGKEKDDEDYFNYQSKGWMRQDDDSN
jgi:hypothetical protein